MTPETVEKLIAINRTFYQDFALAFDATRQRLQPGVLRTLPWLCAGERVLDLGCGNGNLFQALAERGFTGEYLGLDFSQDLIDRAAAVTEGSRAGFLARDLAGDWQAGIRGPFDRITAFAVLHHLPPPTAGHLLAGCRRLLSPAGELALSCWQFLESPEWRARIQPWEEAGLSADQVGPDDYLLDWRRGGRGLRYVHHYDEAELAVLAGKAGYSVRKSFYSDGAGGRLGLYLLLKIDK